MANANFVIDSNVVVSGNIISSGSLLLGNTSIAGSNSTLTVTLDGTQKLAFSGNALTIQNPINTTVWTAIYGDGAINSNSEYSEAVAIDSTGATIIVGGDNNGGFVTKFSTTGAIVWQVNLTRTADTSYAQGIALDASNNIYVSANTLIGFVVIKFNSSGVLQWQTFLTNDITIKYKIGSTIIVDNNGDIIVASNVNNNGVYTDAHVTKIDSTGALVWSKFLTGASVPTFQDVRVDSSDNIYLVGGTTANTSGVPVVIKLNSSGVIQWQKDISAGTGGSALSVAVGTSHIYVAFEYYDSGYKPVIAKLAITDGSIVWNKRFTTNTNLWFQSITIDIATETIFLGGFWNYTTSNDTLLIAIDTNATVLWANNIGTSASDGEWYWYGHRGIDYRSNYITLSGYTSKLGNNDAWLVKVAADGSTTGTAGYFYSNGATAAFADYSLTPSTNGFTSAVNATTFAAGDLSSASISKFLEFSNFIVPITITSDNATLATLTVNNIVSPLLKASNFSYGYGSVALASQTTGNNNSAVGYTTLASLTTGNNNSATGSSALKLNTTGYNNSAVGANTLKVNTVGSYNSAFGYSALQYSTGSYNTAIGYNAGTGIYSGDYNVILGGSSGSGISGFNNHIIISDGAGTERLQIDNAGNANFVGASLSLNGSPISSAIILDGDVTATGTTGANTTVTLNTVNGSVGTYGDATNVAQFTVNDKGLITSVSNVSISSGTFTNDILVNTSAGGITVGTGAANDIYSVAVGKDALMSATGGYNTAIGYNSLKLTTTGFQNTAIGALSLAQNTTGVFNIAIGGALSNSTDNSHNIAIGESAFVNLVSGSNDQNIAIGSSAGSGMVSGNNNVILGGASGSSINGLNNHIIIADGAGTERLQIDNAGNANFVGASLTLNGSPIGGGGNINLTGPITSVGNVTSIASQTGTGNVFVMSADPTLTGVLTVTGNIAATGNISGTRFNNVSITAPATLSTLTIADGKTFTVNNTVTLVGTDATTITLPNVTTAVAGLATTNAFTKPQIGTVTSLSVAANLVAVDLSISNNYTLTLQATTGQTLSNPTGGTTGQSGMITITQNATPSTLAFGANWISTDGTTPTVTTTANAVNLLSYYVVDSSHVWFALSKHGVA